MADFLDQRTSAYAYKHLQYRLRDRKVANRNPVFGNVQSIHQGHLIWREDSIPENLTIHAS
eukprot:6704931-Ditylum_brightwellii.AAC.1